MARKPLASTVAANVLEHGTGALNIDACRVPGEAGESHAAGRWPTNVVLDESQAAVLDDQSGTLTSGTMRAGTRRSVSARDGAVYGRLDADATQRDTYGDTGGASRFFPTFRYEAKAPSSERPRYTRSKLRLRDDLTPAQVDHVRARLAEAGVQVD